MPHSVPILAFRCVACRRVHQRVIELVDLMKSLETAGWLRANCERQPEADFPSPSVAGREDGIRVCNPPACWGERRGGRPATSGYQPITHGSPPLFNFAQIRLRNLSFIGVHQRNSQGRTTLLSRKISWRIKMITKIFCGWIAWDDAPSQCGHRSTRNDPRKRQDCDQ